MKKKALTITNIILFVVLVIIDTIQSLKFGLTADCWFVIVLARFCFIIYLLGLLCPNKTVYFIHKISKTIYKNSSDMQIPVIEESKRILKKRLVYFLLIVNILLLLLMLMLIFK